MLTQRQWVSVSSLMVHGGEHPETGGPVVVAPLMGERANWENCEGIWRPRCATLFHCSTLKMSTSILSNRMFNDTNSSRCLPFIYYYFSRHSIAQRVIPTDALDLQKKKKKQGIFTFCVLACVCVGICVERNPFCDSFRENVFFSLSILLFVCLFRFVCFKFNSRWLADFIRDAELWNGKRMNVSHNSCWSSMNMSGLSAISSPLHWSTQCTVHTCRTTTDVTIFICFSWVFRDANESYAFFQ